VNCTDPNVRRLTAKLGQPYAGTLLPELRFDCPLCEKHGEPTADTHGRLQIHITKQVYICYRCGAKGRMQRLFDALGIETQVTVRSFSEIFEILLSSGVQVEPYDADEPCDYPCQVRPVQDDWEARAYLELQRGFSPEQIEDAGIVVGMGHWGDRIFLPARNAEGIVTYWVARTIRPDGEPKYLNPAGKSRRFHVFNLAQVAQQREQVIITEGVFSAMAAGPTGIATYGKMVSNRQLQDLSSLRFKRYYVALDGGEAIEAMHVADWLTSRGNDVYVVNLPPGKDPDDVRNQFGQYLDAAEPLTLLSRIASLLQ
jgi:hypothetical protein